MATEWTPEARVVLEHYLREIDSRLPEPREELIEDLRAHVVDELLERDLPLATARDVEAVLARLGSPDVVADVDGDAERPPTPSDGTSPGRTRKQTRDLRKATGKLPAFASVLGVLAVLVEAVTHGTASAIFDPLPTLWHVPVVIAAPLAVGWVQLLLEDATPDRLTRAAFASGYALAVGAVYALGFIPAMPLMVIALMLGVGLLGFSPLLVSLAALRQLSALRALEPRVPRRPMMLGAGLGFALLLLVSSSLLATTVGTRLALAEDSGGRAAGFWLLRNVGDDDRLLARCYGRGRTSDMRRLYFQVTGRPFDTQPRPNQRGGAFFSDDNFRDWTVGSWAGDWTTETEGALPPNSRHMAGLSLASSAIDVSIDERGLVAYLEWTLEFANGRGGLAEARAQIALPPDAVGSRLTLWINGEEREAAYATTPRVERAYAEVTARRKDPALLTWASRDRLSLRAFPVPRNGRMKVKVGMTVPLVQRDGEGWLRLPHLVERNFLVPDGFEHALWVEARTPVRGPAGLLEGHPADDLHALRGPVSSAVLAGLNGEALVHVSHPPACMDEQWLAQLEERELLLRCSHRKPVTPAAVVLVVDGSASMKASSIEWQTALERLSPETRVAAVVTGQHPLWWSEEFEKLDAAQREKLAAWLDDLDFDGGHDSVPALLAADLLASTEPGARIVWVHGPYPVELSSATVLEQTRKRRPKTPPIIAFSAVPGANRLAESARVGVFDVYPRLIDTTADLGAALLGHSLSDVNWSVVENGDSAASPATPQLTRIAAALWVADLAASPESTETERSEASREAVALGLITPLTGAVVLETEAQYARNGLEPAKGGTVPAIPEPGTMMLLAAGGASLAWRRRRATR